MSIAAQIEAARLRAQAQQAAQWRPPQTGLGLNFSPTQQWTPRREASPRPTNSGSVAEVTEKWSNYFTEKREAEKAAEKNGFWDQGPLGIAVGALTKPFEVLDVGRRAIVGGWHETLDMLPDFLVPFIAEDDHGSFWDKLSDPTYGAGDMFEDTGNKWLDRGIGFLGDVALDPLTYLTMGTGKFAGAGGRMVAAERLGAAGHRAAAQRASRLGVSAVPRELRQSVLNDQSGFRFMGQTIPGTAKASEVVGTAGGRVRAGLGDVTGFGTTRVSDELELAYKVLSGRTPHAGSMDYDSALGTVLKHNTKRVTEGTVTQRFKAPTTRIRRKSLEERRAMTHAIERGETVADNLSDLLFATARRMGVSGLKRRQNHVAHVPTRSGAQFFNGINQRSGKQVINTGRGSGRLEARMIEPGSTMEMVDGTKITFKDATIEEINDKLAPYNGGAKVLEDDYAVIAETMVRTTASDIGEVAGLRAVAEKFPHVAGRRSDDALYERGYDEALGKELTGEAREGRDAAKGRLKDARTDADVEGMLRNVIATARPLAQRSAAEAQAIIDDATERLGRKGKQYISSFRTRQRLRTSVIEAQEVLDQMSGVTAKAMNPSRHATQRQVAYDLEQVLRQFDGEPGVQAALEELTEVGRKVQELDELGADVADYQALVNAGKNGELEEAWGQVLTDGFTMLDDKLFDPADPNAILVRQEMKALHKVAKDFGADSKWWGVIDDYTKLFKAYATATPGFHTRNAMSAAFMNYVAGVSTKDQLKAINLFRKIRKDPAAWFAQATPGSREWKAVEAAMGAGMGRIGVDELGSLGTTSLGPKMNKALSNRFIDLNKGAGEWVEGPARIALAYKVLGDPDATVADALMQISRYQFDYSQLSSFDRGMKRIIPFWTFMSRSLPLQMQEMWMKPGKYAAIQSAFRNMSDGDSANLPEWMQDQGGFGFAGGALIPDFPHLDVPEQFGYFTTGREGALKFLSSVNPVFKLPAESLAGKNFFQNRPFYEGEDDAWRWLEGLAPTIGQLNRLAVGNVGERLGNEGDVERRRGDFLQNVLNYAGVPYKNVD